MQDKRYTILQKMHKNLYGEDYDFLDMDLNYHTQNAEKLFYENPIFNSLSQKYTLSDISINSTEMTPERVMEYSCIYIYLEYLYGRIRNNPNEKKKLYDKINEIGNDNNFFGYVKLFSVYYSTKITTYFKNPFLLGFFSRFFLMLNIGEAVVEDLLKFQFTNAFIGMYLASSAPFNVSNFRKDEYDNVLCHIDDDWLNLYTSWNTKFTYSDSPGKNYFARTSVCLLNSLFHNKNDEWLNNRAYVLFTSHLLKTYKWFNDDFGYNDKPNPKILKDWDTLNIDYLFKTPI